MKYCKLYISLNKYIVVVVVVVDSVNFLSASLLMVDIPVPNAFYSTSDCRISLLRTTNNNNNPPQICK